MRRGSFRLGLVLLVGALGVACDRNPPPPAPVPPSPTAPAPAAVGTETLVQDRAHVEQRVRDYISALGQAGDAARLRQQVTADVTDAQLEAAQQQARADQYQLLEIPDVQVLGAFATATLRLRLADGSEARRTLELQRVGDEWRVRDPTLRAS
jgi:hypothetical protein